MLTSHGWLTEDIGVNTRLSHLFLSLKSMITDVLETDLIYALPNVTCHFKLIENVKQKYSLGIMTLEVKRVLA